MKVLLINPPRSPANRILEHAPENARRYVHTKLVGPPLGLLTVAAALRDDADLRVIDLKGEYDLDPNAPDPAELTRRAVREFAPDLVGVTVIASEFPYAMDILAAAKATDPSVRTLAGGLHAALCPQDFDRPEVDLVIPGDAVHPVRALVRTLASGGDLEAVGGLLRRTPEGLRPTGAPPLPTDPAGADFVVPARHYLERWMSTYRVGGQPEPVTYLFTSLGCPSRCSFCSVWPQRRGRFLQRDVDSVVEELAGLDEYGIVRFADANTVVDVDWMGRLLDRIEAEGIRKQFVMDLRLDTPAAHPDLIARLARNGLKVVITGIESPRADELARYNKQLDTRAIREGIRVFHDCGVMLRANYVVDPDYGLDDFAALAAFAGSYPTAYAGYTILTPMPGTVLYAQVRDRIVDHDLTLYNFFNCVLPTRLPLDRFYREVGGLWAIREGDHVIS